MMGPDDLLPRLILLIGGVIVVALLLKAALRRLGAPAMIGYLTIGVLLRALRDATGWLPPQGFDVLTFLGEIGVAMLLFRVGFETHLEGLLRQLRRASVIWAVSVVVSGAAGYLAARVLGAGLVPSLFVAVALSATSVGVTLEMWREQGALRTDIGEALLDVAELDDISAVVLMGMLVAVAPTLLGGAPGDALPLGLVTGARYLGSALLFGAGCLLLGRFAVRPVTRFLHRVERRPDPLLSMTALGLIVASAAVMLGFSIAIGAFFAGLMFTRQHEAFERDMAFETLYEVFVPFFFVGIGLMIPLDAFRGGLQPVALLFVVAVAGKVVGAGAPAEWIYRREAGAGAGWALGLGMVPRAEIALIVMRQGSELGAVPGGLLAAMVGVVALTSTITPLVLRPVLRRLRIPERRAPS